MPIQQQGTGKSRHRGKSFRSDWFKVALLFFCLLSIVVSIVYSYQKQAMLNVIKAQEEAKADSGKISIENDLKEKASDLMVLNDLLELKGALAARSDASGLDENVKNQVAREYLMFLLRKKIYDQVLLLDDQGNEIIRVDYNAGRPWIVGRNELKNKSDNYYFFVTTNLVRGDMYVSPFELNVENNKIEEPFKSTLRFATPAFDSFGKKIGTVFLNCLGDDLIQPFKKLATDSFGTAELINSDGYWLSASDPVLEWGFMFPGKEDLTIKSHHPEAWAVIRNNLRGQFINQDGLFTYTAVMPFSYMLTSNRQASMDDQRHSYLSSSEYHWKIVSRIAPATLAAAAKDLRSRFILIWLALMACAMGASYFYVQNRHMRKEYSDRLQEMATHDVLTGLVNRNLFSDILTHNLAYAERYGHLMAVLFMDLDGFKLVNDTYGHDMGDQLLIEAAARFKKSLRKSDTVARMGGDEFAVILSEIGSAADVEVVVSEVLAAIATPFSLGGNVCQVGISIGTAMYPTEGTTEEELLNKADAAMYKVKKRKNQCVIE